LATPTYLTVQINADSHILLYPEELQYINHSCDPNVYFDLERMAIICLRDIAAGEEITFFYPSTEWIMIQPFACHCGAAACRGLVQGAAHMDPAVLRQYRLNKHILAKLAGRPSLAG